MKNVFKKQVAVFKNAAKKGSVFFQCAGGEVFVSNGHLIFHVPYVWYSEFFRPAGPIFPDMEDGARWIKRPSSTLPVLDPTAPDLLALWQREASQTKQRATLLPLTLHGDGEKPDLRLVNIGRRVVGYQAAYVEAALEWCGTVEWSGAATGKWPAISCDNVAGVLILPVNDQGRISEVLEAARA